MKYQVGQIVLTVEGKNVVIISTDPIKKEYLVTDIDDSEDAHYVSESQIAYSLA